MFILDSSLPKPRGRGQSSNTANVAKNISVSLEKLDIESASNSKSTKFCIIVHFFIFEDITNNYGEYLL